MEDIEKDGDGFVNTIDLSAHNMDGFPNADRQYSETSSARNDSNEDSHFASSDGMILITKELDERTPIPGSSDSRTSDGVTEKVTLAQPSSDHHPKDDEAYMGPPQVFCYQAKGGRSDEKRYYPKKSEQQSMTEENCCCVECGVTFANIDLLLKHVQEHETEQYGCDDIYHGSDEGESSDASAVPVSNNMGTISCVECGDVFENVDALLRHVEGHETALRQRQNAQMNGVHECPVCHQGFINERLMLEHVKRHNSRGAKVSIVGNIASPGAQSSGVGPKADFNVYSYVRPCEAGTKNDTGINRTAHLCLICGDVFRQLSSLDKHHLTHDEGYQVLDHKCGLCGKVFSKLDNLHVHMRLHNQDRPYACALCGKRFTQSSHLRQHELIHTEVRPFSCRFCPKTFRQSSHLHMHERIHTGLRPYKCHLCDKAFMQSSHLRIHERTHSRVRPYNCRFCNATFIQSAHMRLHEKKHLSNALKNEESGSRLNGNLTPQGQ